MSRAVGGAACVAALAACATQPSKNAARDAAPDAGAHLDAGDGGAHVAHGVREGGDAPESVPSFEALAKAAAADVAAMPETLRVELTGARRGTVALPHDACLRASFGANREVRAGFVDESGAARGGVVTAPGGLVPPRGPVCGRKGETLSLVAGDGPDDAGATFTRAIVWISAPAAGP